MLNLVLDPWIPILRTDGSRNTVRPDQVAEASVAALDWPRPDLTLACLELLIGLAYLACPPSDGDAWLDGPPAAETFRAGLEPLASAFNLLGDGPRFMQDIDTLVGDANPPEMLFIDSAGESTSKKNADLMVKRDRYAALPPALAAMALFAPQDFAPSGGAGNRTSLRGGGPMVALVVPPEAGLWPMVWANLPFGEPFGVEDLDRLPWM